MNGAGIALCPLCGGTIDSRSRPDSLEFHPRPPFVSHRSCSMGPDPSRDVPSNRAEDAALKDLVSKGARPCHSGYPDFWWVEGDVLCFLEVKPDAFEPFTREQAAFMLAARGQGCRTFRYSPTRGIEEVPPPQGVA